MNEPFTLKPGSEAPLGASLDSKGCNFAVWAPEATAVILCLYDGAEQELARFSLKERKGQYWFGYVAGVKAGQAYGYRLQGPTLPGGLFDEHKLLLDPYAKALSRPLEWDAKAYAGDSAAMMSKSLVVDETAFDWQDSRRPGHNDCQSIFYEAHIKGFTQLHPEVPEAWRGKYLGFCHPAVIGHLQSLGITAVQLLPVASFMSEPRLEDLGLANYWGYNPVCFMAPDPRYGVADAVQEFKTLVRELHKAGIEVILDVVYNHTAEGGQGGPLLCYKGFDNRNYYMFENGAHGPDYGRYVNVTGCGNSFNVDHPNVLRLVMDSLRYWVEQMQVDGFRFDLAVTVAREGNEFDPWGAFFKAVLQDPVLSQVKLVAEPWDIGPFGYRLGQFPSNWKETNDRYRDTVRSFWRGDTGRMADFATRLLGSRDIFPKSYRSIHSSVNFITYHDGFTLEDLVSYEQRHNHANAEDNRDGHGHNLSANNGVEGPTAERRISHKRQQQKRNLLATLLLSQGTPHLLAGDELGRTQMGNNNAYCQDNRISWLSWELREEDERLLEFVRQMISLRRSSSVFSGLKLVDDHYLGPQRESHHVDWYHPDGRLLTDADWNTPVSQVFVMDIGDLSGEGERWAVLFNASDYDIHFRLPAPSDGRQWEQVVDTAASDGLPFLPDDIRRQVALGRAHSIKLLRQVVESPAEPAAGAAKPQ
ncbi:glycogen debranching protein GlgX [Pseudaeromonas sp. ZJS20]|uniref:glycogen debranching protein GlgX n=1 Tax=Pseudaeromonas aegiceratis TaxID=3153928 RepID=UPI00390C6908